MVRTPKAVVALVAALVVGVGVFAFGVASGQRSQTFTDVPAGSYYHDAVYWAAELDITTGCTDDKFCPDDTLTRAQMITFLYRYHNQNNHTPPSHTHEDDEDQTDVKPIPSGEAAGTGLECLTSETGCNLANFGLEQDKVLVVGTDIAPGRWHTEIRILSEPEFDSLDQAGRNRLIEEHGSRSGYNDKCVTAAVLTDSIRKHPQYPGIDPTWSAWPQHLVDLPATGYRFYQFAVTGIRSELAVVVFDVDSTDFAVIYSHERGNDLIRGKTCQNRVSDNFLFGSPRWSFGSDGWQRLGDVETR